MFHVLAGALIGAVIGGAASAIGSLVKGEPVSWKKVGAAALGGAVAGSVASLTFGAGLLAGSAVTQAGGMVAAGAIGGATEQTTDNVLHDKPWHEDVGESAAIGGAFGAVGAAGRLLARPLASLASAGAGRLSSAGRSVSNALKPHVQRLTGPARRLARRLITPVTDTVKRQASRYLSPVARAARRRILDPLRRRVFDPLARALEPVLRPLRPVFRPVGRLWQRYKGVLETHPIRTKSATAASIAMTGDVIGQAVEGRDEWDWRRTLFRGGFAALWSGPMGHYWFGALDKMIPGNAWGAVLSKIAVDQLLWAPVSGTVFFGSYSMIYDGMTPAESIERVKRDLPRALKAQYTVWPVFHLFNFRYVPLNMRVPASATAGLGWSVFFSTLLNGEDEDAGEHEHVTDEPVQPRVINVGLGESDRSTVHVSRPRARGHAEELVEAIGAYNRDRGVMIQDHYHPPGVLQVEALGIVESMKSFAPELMPQR